MIRVTHQCNQHVLVSKQLPLFCDQFKNKFDIQIQESYIQLDVFKLFLKKWNCVSYIHKKQSTEKKNCSKIKQIVRIKILILLILKLP